MEVSIRPNVFNFLFWVSLVASVVIGVNMGYIFGIVALVVPVAIIVVVDLLLEKRSPDET